MHAHTNNLQPDTLIANPEQCRVVSAVEIPADAQAVWAVAGNFGGFQAFVPALESITVTGEGRGSVRHKRFRDGNVVIEQLNSRDDDALYMTWTLIHTSLPVGRLWAAMTVEPASDAGCVARWTIMADPLPDSSAALSDFEAFLQSFADSAMQNLRGLFA
jgi:hypothetical protein